MKAKIAIVTQGCTNNVSESEAMGGILKKSGFDIVDNPEEAEIIILNICTVKGNKNALDTIADLKKLDKRIILAGCIPKESYKDFRELLPESCFISTHNIKDIVEIVEEALNDSAIDLMAQTAEVKIGLPRIRANKYVGILPILTGCNNSCAYCSVKLIKGELLSYPTELIMQEAEKAVREGCKELWVTSMDNAAYGIDKGKPALPELIKSIASIQGDFKIRIGMMNPSNVMMIAKELIEAYKNDKVYKFLHIPVQSGSNDVLKAMNRKYIKEDFVRLVDAFETEIPNITISTDIICGFPGETDAQFEESLDLISMTKPDVLNIARYSARPRTRAFYMENQVHGNISKERSRALTDLHNNVSRIRNEKWLKWQGPVLILEREQDWIGRNFAYKPVVIKTEEDLMGKTVNVRIVKVFPHYIIGEITDS
jgi:threonylcarbamoyladenosine tRNA methylthiotransferase CDKAL1